MFFKWFQINTVIFCISTVKFYLSPIVSELFSTSVLSFIFSKTDKPLLQPKRSAPSCLWHYLVSTVIVKSTTHSLIDHTIGYSWIYFIPLSFLFELIFDIAHYCGHRLLHHRALYRFHKPHHVANPRYYTAFQSHPLDIIFAYSIPYYVANYFVQMSPFQITMIQVYLSYQEIGGHLGMAMRPTTSFAQCVYLPRMLGIELSTEDHDLHHKYVDVNFSKRFKIMDILFNTYYYPAADKSSINLPALL